MADINIQMGQRNAENTEWDNLYPITKAENVITADGNLANDLEAITPKGITSDSPFYPCQPVHATLVKLIKGFDSVLGIMFAVNMTVGYLEQSTDYGNTWSANKGFPGNITYQNLKKIIRFKGKYYALGMDAADSNLYKVYRCDPAAGNNPFIWELVHTLSVNASTLGTQFNCDSEYIYLGEYCISSITGGPSIWRSADGITWDRVYGPDSTMRHIHGINSDPYNPGHVWACCGDGMAKSIMRSTNYGATGSWEVIVASSLWQSVQISFSKTHIWFSGDSDGRATAFVIDRSKMKIKSASPNSHHMIAIPGEYLMASTAFNPGTLATGTSIMSNAITLTGAALGDFVAVAAPYDLQGCAAFGVVSAANTVKITVINLTGGSVALASGTWKVRILRGAAIGDRFNTNAYYGLVDPDTGIYYCISNDTSAAGGNRTGLFYIPGVGRRVELLDHLPAALLGTYNFEPYIINGYLYFEQYKHKLLTFDDI